MCACTTPVRTGIGAVCVGYGRPKWPITMLNRANKQTSLVQNNVCFFYFWHPMLVRPVMNGLFFLWKSKEKKARFARAPHYKDVRRKAIRAAFFVSVPFCFDLGGRWCGSWILVFRRPRLELFRRLGPRLAHRIPTHLSHPVDIPELVCGEVCGRHPLNHTGMRTLRSLAGTPVLSTYIIPWRWGLADGVCTEVSTVWLTCAKKTGR